MNLEDISNESDEYKNTLEGISSKHQEELVNFFKDDKVIEYIYKEQFGEENYNAKDNFYVSYKDRKLHHKYHDKFEKILETTVFIPYITLDNLDDMLINAQKTYGRFYLGLDENADKKEQLNQKIKSAPNDIREKNSSLILKELEQVFPNLPEEQYSTILKHCSNIEISALENIILVLDDDEYSKILQNSSNIDGDENTKYINLDTLKELLPNLTEENYSKIIKHCSDVTAQLIADKYFMNKNTLFSKKKKLKAQEIIEKNIKMTDQKIKKEVDNIKSDAELFYGLEATMKRFGKEIKLSKKLNAQKKDIIKKYSSFMLDDLKQLFHDLSEDEYSKILKNCKNNSFDENAKFIEDNLFKDKKGFLLNLQKNKAQQIVEKYRELTSKKILMETSSFYKHFSEVPKGKYYADILEKMSKSNVGLAVSCIGRKSKKNIRYIFLPVLQYKNKDAYIKTALHEIMHISKEQITEENVISGMVVDKIPKNPNASTEIGVFKPFDLLGFIKRLNWLPRYEKKFNLAARHTPTTEKKDLSSKYNANKGIVISEETEHNNQVNDVFLKIKKSGLLDKIQCSYFNTSKNDFLDYDSFNDATKEFDSYFKEDIQKINRGESSLKEFKRNVGIKNFDAFAKTAYLCTNDPESFNMKNSRDSKRAMYNNIGIQIVREMVDKNNRTKEQIERRKENSEKRKKFLDKVLGRLSPSEIINTGKDLEETYSFYKNKKNIDADRDLAVLNNNIANDFTR